MAGNDIPMVASAVVITLNKQMTAKILLIMLTILELLRGTAMFRSKVYS